MSERSASPVWPKVYWTVALLASVAVPIALAVFYRQRDPDNWQESDWASTLISISTGLIFFALAYVAGRRAERRNRAVANATLATSVGRLATSSSRIGAGNDDQALRVASEARAALEYYDTARRRQQRELIDTVSTANTDLVFGTFCRADGLSRAVWSTLSRGQTDLAKEIEELRERRRRRSKEQDCELVDLRDHVRFAYDIGSAVVLSTKRPPTPGNPATVVPSPETPAERGNILRRFQRLYQNELVVVKQWDLLHQNSTKVECSVVLHALDDTKGWCAPWYVRREGESISPVNVEGRELNEAAQHDTIEGTNDLPLYPRPLLHGAIPKGVRVERLRALREVIARTRPITVCVLVYELAPFGDNRRPRWLVLDGNHRLAAAHTLPTGADHPVPRVLAFVIRECEALTVIQDGDPDVRSWDPRHQDWAWQGFTPDVGLLRGIVPKRDSVTAEE